MHRITIDDATQLELFKTHDRIEVCDKDGAVIGVFVSLQGQDPKLYQWARAQLSDAELARRKIERGQGSTTAEVIQALKAR